MRGYSATRITPNVSNPRCTLCCRPRKPFQPCLCEVSDELIDAAEVVCSTLIGCGCDALLQSSFDTVTWIHRPRIQSQVWFDLSTTHRSLDHLKVLRTSVETIVYVGVMRPLPYTIFNMPYNVDCYHPPNSLRNAMLSEC